MQQVGAGAAHWAPLAVRICLLGRAAGTGLDSSTAVSIALPLRSFSILKSFSLLRETCTRLTTGFWWWVLILTWTLSLPVAPDSYLLCAWCHRFHEKFATRALKWQALSQRGRSKLWYGLNGCWVDSCAVSCSVTIQVSLGIGLNQSNSATALFLYVKNPWE